jgi:copper chaperone
VGPPQALPHVLCSSKYSIMSTLRFKTTINCGGCIKAVTPTLNKEVGPNNWQVDTADPNKILTVTSGQVSVAQVLAAVEQAGFEITPLN